MQTLLVSISARKAGKSGPATELVDTYLQRAARYTPVEERVFPSETKFLSYLEGSASRTRPYLLLADSAGQQLSSPELAQLVSGVLDSGTQLLALAIGPADGWSIAARKRADKLIAFGRITLAHELALVVAAEQLYRAFTIRAGHPYHLGH